MYDVGSGTFRWNNRKLWNWPSNLAIFCLLGVRDHEAKFIFYVFDTMLSCCRSRKTQDEREREPLLPRYNDDTAMQRELHQKLHTYQMVRALTLGFMPSNEQTIINLRTLLALDVLNPNTTTTSDSGRLLVRYIRQFVQQLIDLLQHKNNQDSIQDFVWFLSHSKLHLDSQDIRHRASKAKARADTVAAYKSLQTVTSLLFTNADFRIFVSDLQTIGREIFRDSAFALSEAADDAAKKVEASSLSATDQVVEPPTGKEIARDAEDVGAIAGKEGAAVIQAAQESVKEHFSGDERNTLIERLKKTVLNLRQRTDYSDSVSTISLLIRKYAFAYSRIAEETAEATQQGVSYNDEMDLAVKNFWSLITSFGDPQQWRELEKRVKEISIPSGSRSRFRKISHRN